ncbi:MAG: alpha/beta hydrolase [Nioella sp.]
MTGFVRYWGAGPRAVLALHCSLAHSGAWEGVARALGPGLHLTAPDILGHGKAPGIDPARDLHDQCYEAILPHLPEGRCDVIGHSFGATLALRLAEQRPDRIRSLTLIEPVLFAAAKSSGVFSAHLSEMADYAAAEARADRAATARAFLSVWGNGRAFEDLPAAQQTYATERIHLIKAAEPALFEDSAGLVPRLREVAAPTLLVEGGESPRIIHAILDRMARDIPDTTRLCVPGAGHMVPITHPGPVAKAIRALFDRSAYGARSV